MRPDAPLNLNFRRQLVALHKIPFSSHQFALRPHLSPILSTKRFSSSSTATSQSTTPSQSPPTHQFPPPRPNPTAANPPATTRPPPLDLPDRSSSSSTFQHLFATGKAYLTFYKTGLRHIITNTRVLYPRSSGPPFPPPPPNTRAALQFRARWSHDIRRLPQFALMLLICGEFTPLVVLLLPGVVPLTCRIPKQVDGLLKTAEERRGRVLEEWRRVQEEGKMREMEGLVARGLGLVWGGWEKIGFTFGKGLVGGRVKRRLKFLAEDDRLLMEAGGVRALESSEVRLACAERGMNVLGRGEEELRRVLDRWLRLVGGKGMAEEERERKIMELILTEEEHWPKI